MSEQKKKKSEPLQITPAKNGGFTVQSQGDVRCIPELIGAYTCAADLIKDMPGLLESDHHAVVVLDASDLKGINAASQFGKELHDYSTTHKSGLNPEKYDFERLLTKLRESLGKHQKGA